MNEKPYACSSASRLAAGSSSPPPGREPLRRGAPRRRPRLGVEPGAATSIASRAASASSPSSGCAPRSSRCSSQARAVLERRRSRSFVEDRDDARPAGARALELEGERRDGEAGRPRQRLEVREPLDLAVLLLAAEQMATPRTAPVLRCASSIITSKGRSSPQASIPISFTPLSTRNSVASRAQARMPRLVAGLLEVGARHDEHDVERLELVSDPRELRLDVRARDPGDAVARRGSRAGRRRRSTTRAAPRRSCACARPRPARSGAARRRACPSASRASRPRPRARRRRASTRGRAPSSPTRAAVSSGVEVGDLVLVELERRRSRSRGSRRGRRRCAPPDAPPRACAPAVTGTGRRPATTRFEIVPMPSTVIVTTSPASSGGGSRRPARPQSSPRQPPPHVPEPSTSPVRTHAPREAYATSSSNDQAMLASVSPPTRSPLTEHLELEVEPVAAAVRLELVRGHDPRAERDRGVLPLRRPEPDLHLGELEVARRPVVEDRVADDVAGARSRASRSRPSRPMTAATSSS